MSHQKKHANAFRMLLARLFQREIRAWQGNARLSTVFWRYGVLTSSILVLLYATTVFLHQLIAEQILLILFALYTIWILVAMWRCSVATDSLWSLLARFLTVAWAANVALILLFRQLELLVLFAS
jgi:hypothetical protein